MKKLYLLFIAVLLAYGISNAQTAFTATYNFNGNSTLTASNQPAGGTFSQLTQVGLTNSSSSNTYIATGWNAGNPISNPNNKYFGFTVTPKYGYKLSISAIEFSITRGDLNSPIYAHWRGSHNDYASPFTKAYYTLSTGGSLEPGNDGVFTYENITGFNSRAWDLKPNIANSYYTDITNPVGFRFYFNKAVDATKSAGFGDGQLTIKGTYQPITCTQANNVSNVETSTANGSANLSWTNANSCADHVLVIVKSGGGVVWPPINPPTDYTGSSNFGSGTTIELGYVVYRAAFSDGNSVNITNLTNGTTYHYKIYTYSSSLNQWSLGVAGSFIPNIPSLATDHFRTTSDGNWNNLSIWESSSDGANWRTASLIPNEQAQSIAIHHNVKVNSSATIANTTVEATGTLDFNSEATLTVSNQNPNEPDLTVFGTILYTEGTLTGAKADIKFESGSTFKYDNDNLNGNGDIEIVPIVNATWDPNSNFELIRHVPLEVTNYSSWQLNQVFGNFIVNMSEAITQNINLTINFHSGFEVAGDFIVTKTGKVSDTYYSIRLVGASNGSLNIGGDLILNGGHMGLNNGAGAVTLTVNGDIKISEGSRLYIATGGNGNSVINLKGNIDIESGLILENGTGSDLRLRLNGTGDQSIKIGTAGMSDQVIIIINKNSGNAYLADDAAFSHNLTLTTGKLILGNYNLSVAGDIGRNNGYIVTEGTGSLTKKNISASTVLPIGSTTAYLPLTVSNGGGFDYSARVTEEIANDCGEVDADQSIAATWHLGSTNPTPHDVVFQFDFTNATKGAEFDDIIGQVVHCGTENREIKGSVSGTVATASGFTSFSPFIISSDLGPLPLQLNSFTGTSTAKGVLLQWNTAMEANTSHFEIERKSNNEFTSIGKVNAKNATNGAAYQLEDWAAPQGANSYRLKMVDIDGSFTYSPIVVVEKIYTEYKMSLYNNPVQSILPVAVSGPTGNAHLRILSINGNILYTESLQLKGATIRNIDVSQLAAGLYIIQFTSGKTQQSLKFVKQ